MSDVEIVGDSAQLSPRILGLKTIQSDHFSWMGYRQRETSCASIVYLSYVNIQSEEIIVILPQLQLFLFVFALLKRYVKSKRTW